jgi:predicted transposase YbfD/YdcC
LTTDEKVTSFGYTGVEQNPSRPKEVEMHHSTGEAFRLASPADADGFFFDLGSFYEQAELLNDPRAPRGRRYALALLLSLLVLAKLCGEDTPTGIADWVRWRCALLVQGFQLARATMPSHNTFRRILQRSELVSAVPGLVQRILAAAPQAGLSRLIAVDGKTLRGTIAAGVTQGIHLLAAYLPAEGLVLMQVLVENKENEIPAAPRLLKSLDLRGKIVMGDALHTQREVSVQILDADGEYIWYAKDNQPKLHQDIAQLFVPEVTGKGSRPVPTDFGTASQIDCGHGRIEKRTLTTSSLLRRYLDWPGVQQVFKLERVVTDLQRKPLRAETVYGLTSLSAPEASPLRLLELTRSYWGIENGLHYRRDVTLHEDATRMHNAHQAQLMASLNNFVIGLVLQHGFTNLAAARRYYAANFDAAFQLLTRQPS